MGRTFMGKTGFICSLAASLILGAAAFAADTTRNAFAERLDSEVQNINQRYEDVQKELDEEYRAIAKEKDEYSEDIAEEVNEIQQKRQDALQKFDADYKKFEENMRSANIPASDKRYVDAAAPMKANREAIDRTYETSLATLQQLYQLNNKRFAELTKIHSARESIEAARHREERAMTEERVRRDARLASADAQSDAGKRTAALRDQRFSEMRQGAENRYNAALNALDEYRDLVNARLEQQRDYLSNYASIMEDLNRPDITPADRASYAEKLGQLNAQKDAEERKYQNNALFIEEKLTFEQMRAREMARLNDDRRQVEESWINEDQGFRTQLAQLDNSANAANISDAEKKNIADRRERIAERQNRERENYQQALNNLEERQQLVQQAMDDRLAYLESRNDIRLSMADKPMTEDAFANYRSQIANLEERRISNERAVRDRLLSLTGSMPANYRMASMDSPRAEMRKERILGRLDARKADLQNKLTTAQQQLNQDVQTVNQKLAAANLPQEERTRLENQRAALNRKLATHRENVAKSIERLDARKDLEEKRMAARTEYIAKRNALRDGFKMDTAQYNDVADYERRLDALDKEFADQEREYFENLRGMGSAAPVPMTLVSDDMPNQAGADWNNEAVRATQTRVNTPANATMTNDADDRAANALRNAQAVQSTPSAEASNARVVREGENRESIGEEVKDAWQSVKDAVVNSYNNAVHYLTD